MPSATALEAEKLRRNLELFFKSVWPLVEGNRPLKWGWHLSALCLHLQALAEDRLGTRRVIFNIPPRHTKSSAVTIVFPIWMWTRNPSLQFMFASYSFSLARDHAYKRRAILESEWFKERYGDVVKLSGDRNNIMEIGNSARGLFTTTSVGGSVVGRGGDYLLLDDGNDIEQMESEVQRTSILRWLDVTWSTRANDPKTVREVNIQQRSAEKDISGHLIEQKEQNWLLVKIPMQLGSAKPCVTPIWKDPRTNPNELIDSERFPEDYIAAQKIRLGPIRYAGIYDQEPAPLGGGIVKTAWLNDWIWNNQRMAQISDGRTFDVWNGIRFATVDLAFTEEEIGAKKQDDPDYTVMAAWFCCSSEKGPLLFLLDLIRERLEGPDILTKLDSFHRHWKFQVIGFESVQAQKALFQYAQRAPYQLPVREISNKKNDAKALYTIDGDKMARVVAATPLMARGGFFLPAYAPWRMEYTQELTRFPNAAHDDCCDVTSYAIPIAEKLAKYYQPMQGQSERVTEDTRRDELRDENPNPWDAIRVRRP